VTTTRAEAIEEFAAVLRALRTSAGSPSFRTMSGLSHAISHTTLHDAVQGNRLPSWETTAEFAKACGADPNDFRHRWNAANAAVRAAPSSPLPETEPEIIAQVSRRPAYRRWFRQAAVASGLIGTLTLGSVLVDAVAAREDVAAGRQGVGVQPSVTPAYTAANCPVQQPNPSPAPVANAGDRAVFVGDITLPDCTHVAGGSTVTKVWRFKNSGTRAWHGYVLHRLDGPQRRDQCQTITDVAIGDTGLGAMVDVRVVITAPNVPTFCFVRFKIEDSAGRIAFPGSRPVNFQLIVDASEADSVADGRVDPRWTALAQNGRPRNSGRPFW
jgi:hypothetical protein